MTTTILTIYFPDNPANLSAYTVIQRMYPELKDESVAEPETPARLTPALVCDAVLKNPAREIPERPLGGSVPLYQLRLPVEQEDDAERLLGLIEKLYPERIAVAQLHEPGATQIKRVTYSLAYSL